jgi:hypothetical protein
MTHVILDEADTDRILKLLYNGTRPTRIHTLVCSCGRFADLRASECAWNGWQLLPYARCPWCLGHRRALVFPDLQPQLARERFETLMRALGAGRDN